MCVQIKSIPRRLGKESMKIQVENCNEFPEESPVAVSFFVRCSKKANHFMTSELEEQVGKPRCRCCVI